MCIRDSTCFASIYWRLDDFRSSLDYYDRCPDSVLRAMNKDNGGGYWTKRQVLDKLLEAKAGSKTALDEVMDRLNWEDENEKKYKVSKEIAEHEIGRKVST